MMTTSSDYWTGLRDSLTSLALDWGRAKLLDVERATDDRNIPDAADMRYGQAAYAPGAAGGVVLAPGGIPITTWAAIGVLVVVAVVLVRRVT